MDSAGAPDSLRAVLDAFLENPPVFHRSRIPQSAVQITKATERLIEQFGNLEPKPPSASDLAEIYLRVKNAWQTEDGSSLSQRDIRMAPWVFFYPASQEAEWLGVQPNVIWAYQSSTAAKPNRSTLALLREFLRASKPEHPTHSDIRSLLQVRLLESKVTHSPSVRRWQERCLKFGLLRSNNAGRLLEVWHESEMHVEDLLIAAGLSPGLERSELMQRAIKEILRKVRDGLEQRWMRVDELSRHLEWLCEGNQLRLSELRVEIAEALLGPYTGTARPTKEVSAVLRPFFLNHFGDPRLRASGWAGVPEPQRQVLMRLLVELALQDFFRLLDNTAQDDHWMYRKKFWTAYLDKGVIDHAWIVLGPEARAMARQNLKSQEVLSSGSLTGAGVQSNHSVLLMKIGSITVAEWSHNGRCRFWLESNRKAPSLYRPSYEGRELNNLAAPDCEVTHAGSPYATWQRKAVNWLEERTRVRLQRYQYMPDGADPKKWLK